MAKDQTNNDLYKKLICDMVQEINDGRFLRQIYSYIYRERRLSGRLQEELYAMIAEMDTADLRLLWIAAKEMNKSKKD